MIPFALLSIALCRNQGMVTLKFHPPVGKTYRYHMTMDMSMTQSMMKSGAMGSKTDVDLSMKVLSRKGDVTTLQTRSGKPEITLPPGSPMAGMKQMMEKQAASREMTTEMDSQYRYMGGTGMATNTMGGMSNLKFPNHPLRIGESWTTSMDMGKMLGAAGATRAPGMKAQGIIPIQLTLAKVTHEGGKAMAEIAMLMDGNASMMTAGQSILMHLHTVGSVQVEIESGMMIRSHSVSDTTTKMQTMSMSQHMVQSMTPK